MVTEYQNVKLLYSVIMSYQHMQHCHQVVGAATTKQGFQNLLMVYITAGSDAMLDGSHWQWSVSSSFRRTVLSKVSEAMEGSDPPRSDNFRSSCSSASVARRIVDSGMK